MRLPAEILVLILQQAVGTLPVEGLVRMRLVNSTLFNLPKSFFSNASLEFFANEVMTIITKDPTILENDGFGFGNPDSPIPGLRWWSKFPAKLKHRYLHLKVQRHTQNPCLFSSHVQEILDLPNNRTTRETEALLDKMIDVFCYVGFLSPQHMLDSESHTCSEGFRAFQRSLWESPAITLPVTLAISAIIRGDAAELESIYLNTGMRINRKSYRFSVMPLTVAAKIGSEDVIKTIIKCSGKNGGRALRGFYWLDVAIISARAGNLTAIKLFTEYHKAHNNRSTQHHFLAQATRASARAGELDVMHYCVTETRDYFKNRENLLDSLIQAIKSGQVDTAKYLLDCGEFDINDTKIQSWDCGKGALFTVLHDCPAEKRPAIMKLILDHGADPNRIYPFIPRTPFQAAVKLGDVQSAAALVEYGADIHAASLLPPPALMMPLLLQAIEHRSAPLVELLLNSGVDRFCDWRRKRYTIHDGTEENNLENIFCKLTWDQEEEEKEGYYVTVQRFSTL